ncbi:phosphoadenosine phosphosulfate reductase domain-containing protein [Sphingobium sp. CCH11-B1]|jgi:3'-phosphoadenosine 5'-phosphosulfate sulfotransferase (PAPS reductase)/FAD synthetase|uniref:phosphoadenosine phosphosulfate reductase domain-containing protein n=1 Tax=Sphingobium sp. CCH11-B1 TaxID=1768781 RepID=UPI00082A8DED|nr:phosphoadenosine phosphosulfate reductase family protein [Sphingobium sp. CCH11-B1]
MGAALARGLLAAPYDPLPAIDDTVLAAVRRGAWFAFNLSGGKDSTASAHAAIALLDALGHPRDRRIAIHADLGRAEWRSTPSMVAAIAERLGLPLLVVSRSAGDMVARWEQRFLAGKRRYEALETYNLIGPWSSASLRFCTSELKVQVIGPELARRYRGETIVSVIGLRRDESPSRRATPVSRTDERFAKPGNAAGTHMLTWHPAVDWSADDVFGIHERHSLPLHEAYVRYRTTRLSCAFCVLASVHDLAASADAPGNLDLYRHLVAIELDSTFSFQPQRWLADVAPQLLSAAHLHEVARVKVRSHARRTLEAAMPPELRYVKGCPPRLPSLAEAALIAKARAPILAHHGLADHFPDAAAVQARFADLLAMKAERLR